MFDVKGKCAFVTGGTSGIGLATAERLVSAGARVVIVGRRDEGAEIAERIGAHFVQADLTVAQQLSNSIEQAHQTLGAIDIVFNNAGLENTGPLIEEADAVEFERVLALNLKAAYSVIHQVAPQMRDDGSIINNASVAGLIQLPGYAQYSASKAAVISLTKSAAIELAPRRIRVNAVCPGSVWSGMLREEHPEVEIIKTFCPLERVGNPEEVAALVHFLASDDARYITGAAIPIDGGLLAGIGFPVMGKVIGEG